MCFSFGDTTCLLISHADSHAQSGVVRRKTDGSFAFKLRDHHRGGGFGFGFGFRAGGVDAMDAAATYIGISEDQLRTELQSGKTLAQVATAHGKTKDGLKQAIHDATKTSLDQAVKDGKVTQTVADQILSRLDSSLEQLVTSNRPAGGPHFRGHGFGGGMPPMPPATAPDGSVSAPAPTEAPVGSA